jgi:PAS domain S-box-containing protein
MGTRKQALSRDELAITLFEESGDALFLFDPVNEKMIDVNPMAERLSGFYSQELLDREVTYLFRSPIQGNLQRLRSAFKVTGLFHSQEDFLLRHRKEGVWVPVNLTVTRLHCRGGTLGLIMARDISEHRRLEEQVIRLAAIVGSSEDAIIGTTIDGTIIDWNSGAERLYGHQSHEIVGKNISSLVLPDGSEEVVGVLAQISEGQRVATFDTVHRRKDGTPVDVAVTLSPIQVKNRIIGAAVIAQGISGRKRLEEELRQAHKMEAIGQLAGGVAHDFNNLLTVINGYSDILLSDPCLEGSTRSLIQEIHKAGVRSASLTAQLLAFSRRQVLEPKLLNLNERVKGIEQLLGRLIGEDIALATTLDPDPGYIKVDPGQLDQVLINLAVNARDAMRQGGKLTLATAIVERNEICAKNHPHIWPGRYVLLSVSDTGIGMDEETKARIFEPFFTTKGPGKGTGLGLAVVHGIIAQSGGHIELTSEPGRGTTFKIYFPKIADAPRKTERSHRGIRSEAKGTETVLLVEDEEGVRRLARRALELAGYRVLEAVNGAEGIGVAENHPGQIDVLVTDVVMPEMGGSVLADRLSVLRPGIKVLFLSGYTDDSVVRHGVLGSEINFLQKPFTPDVLTRRVRAVLDQPVAEELTIG